MKLEFEGRSVVVTGGTGALGGAVVKLLTASGARCYIPQHASGPSSVESESDGVLVPNVDLRDETAVVEFYRGIPELWAAVNCAGGFAMRPFAETTLQEFERQLDMNLKTCFLSCREAVRRIRDTGKGGRIINVAARPALEARTGSGMVAYTVSKAGVAALTESLAQELSPEGIWVNAIVPSIMDTPANRKSMPGASHKEWPTVEAVAATIAFLVSPQNLTTRGALVTAYGNT